MNDRSTRTGGEWIVDALRVEGVRHVFGIPGVHNLAIYDALIRQSEITHVLARHEAGAAFMADGYARASGAPGVVVVTTGPGATNALTPLVESYAGSMPVLVVMSDVASPLVGRDLGALHEVVNQIECFRPVTRWAEAVTEAAAIPTTVHGAFDLLRTGRPGPIAISVPNDFLTSRFDAAPGGGGHGRRPPCHVEAIHEAARLLAAASRPLLIAGGGVIAAEADAELARLARRLGAPVITTVMGRGAISEWDPLWHGVLPNSRATEAVIKAATFHEKPNMVILSLNELDLQLRDHVLVCIRNHVADPNFAAWMQGQLPAELKKILLDPEADVEARHEFLNGRDDLDSLETMLSGPLELE